MPNTAKAVAFENRSGEPVTVDGVTLTPQSQALTVRFPYGGFVWHRPAAVIVEEEGQSRRIPIVDVTRMAQVGAYCVVLLWALLYLIVARVSGRNEHGE